MQGLHLLIIQHENGTRWFLSASSEILADAVRKNTLLLRCDFSIMQTVLFDWGWEREERGVDCAFFFFFLFNFEIILFQEAFP